MGTACGGHFETADDTTQSLVYFKFRDKSGRSRAFVRATCRHHDVRA